MCTGMVLSVELVVARSPNSCNAVRRCLKEPPKSNFILKYLAKGSRHVPDCVFLVVTVAVGLCLF